MLPQDLSAQTKVLMNGIALGESPRWHDGRLWFADWFALTSATSVERCVST